MTHNRIKHYSLSGAARLFSLPVGVFASAIALLTVAGEPEFSLLHGLVAATGSVLVQAAANFINDYSDLQNPALRQQLSDTQVRVIRLNTRLGALCLLVAGLLGAWLMTERGVGVLALALGGLIMTLAYNIEPLALKKRGLGMLLVSLMMGPYMMSAIAWCATGVTPPAMTFWHSILLSLPIGLLLLSNEYRDIDYDQRNGDRTLAVRLGVQPTRMIWRAHLWLTLAAYTLLLVRQPVMLPALIPLGWLVIRLHRLASHPDPALPPATGRLVLLLGLTHSIWLMIDN